MSASLFISCSVPSVCPCVRTRKYYSTPYVHINTNNGVQANATSRTIASFYVLFMPLQFRKIHTYPSVLSKHRPGLTSNYIQPASTIMAKKGKKRPSSKGNPQCHISNEHAVDSLESCLQELEQETNPLYVEEHKNDNEGKIGTSTSSSESKFPVTDPEATYRREKVELWDAEFRIWSKNNGQYSRGLLPCFETELARHFQVKELSAFLLNSCSDLKMPAFERWLLDAKLEEKQKARLSKSLKKAKLEIQQIEPVLPQGLSVSSDSSKRLIEEIVETGVEEGDAVKIVQDVFRRTEAAIKEIASQNLRCAHQAPFKTDRISVEHGSYLVSLLYSRKKWKSPFIVKLNVLHYEKLKQRFINMHKTVVNDMDFAAHKRKNKIQHAFHLLLMVMTLRYSSLSGGQLLDDFRGGGMQGGINEHAFEVFKNSLSKISSVFECFASPFNATLPYFASAFEDLDWHFGSVGDLAYCSGFQDGCCCEANPPFTPGFMEFLADRIDHHIAIANSKNLELTFVVVVPAVHEKDLLPNKARVSNAVKRFAARAHQRMVKGSACRLHIVLQAKEHGYVEGAQHLRPTRYKRSLYDTSVIVLQSKKALGNPLDEDEFQKNVKESFAERHSDEKQNREASKMSGRL